MAIRVRTISRNCAIVVSPEPAKVRPDERGRITPGTHVRAALSRWFFEDRIEPVTKAELERVSHH